MAEVQNVARRNENKRIQFEFSADVMERLNKMKEHTKVASFADLVRNSLRIYEWVLDQEAQGNEIGVVSKDKMVKAVKFLY